MELLCKIRNLQRAVNRFESEFEQCYGISLNEGMALCSLASHKRLCTGELGDLLGLTPSNTSKVIRSIENKELVERELGDRDHRQMYFRLTTKGEELLSKTCCKKVGIPDILARAIELEC